MKLGKFLKLIFSVLVCQLAGLIGLFFTAPAIPDWYAALQKPVFSPPNWLFGPVWFLLYLLMGIALYLVWQKGLEIKKVRLAFILFLIHLIFNALWSILFFGLKNPLLALSDIILIWLLIIILMLKFWPLDRRASYLLIPYLLWVCFATLLNLSIVILN